jgi:hypothetical protein
MPTILVKRNANTDAGALAIGEIGFHDVSPWSIHIGTTAGNKEVGLNNTDRTKLSGIEASADVTDAGNIGSVLHAATEKTTLAANDELALADSGASYALKKLLWSTIKAYIDGVAIGIDLKNPVRVATTENGTLATAYENGDTIDGVTLATGDRILIKDQTNEEENGIYVVKASGAPDRATDADVSAEVTFGMLCFVLEGTANGNEAWMLTTADPITLDTTELVFTQFASITGGSTTFVGLTDTPASYAEADALKLVRVNAAHNALEFTDTIDGGTWPA